MEWHEWEVREVVARLFSREEEGLTTGEALQRRRKMGKNCLEEKQRHSLIRAITDQFINPLILILLAASCIKFFVGSFLDAGVILATILLMITVAIFQEIKAEKALEALKDLAAPQTKVVREGMLQIIPSAGVTVGDIVALEAGDKVPADGRVSTCLSLQVDESMLTGESRCILKTSDPLEKEKDLPDRTNMVYSGTVVVHGKGTFVVTSIGMETEVGKIARALHSQKKAKTPLQRSIDHFGTAMLAIIFTLTLLFVGMGWSIGMGWLELFLLCVAMIVAAVPEGLPATVTVVLAAGVHLMSKKGAIIRKLIAVETLGATTVICTDKTGTLTKNSMSLTALASYDGEVSLEDRPVDKRWTLLLELGALCNNGTLHTKEEGEGAWIGDPTDVALLAGLSAANISFEECVKEYPRLGEIPFSSEKKFMATLHNCRGEKRRIVKGSPELLIDKATEVVTKKGNVAPLSSDHKKTLQVKIQSMGEQGLRVLALAYQKEEGEGLDEETLLDNLIFCGLFALIDPPPPRGARGSQKVLPGRSTDCNGNRRSSSNCARNRPHYWIARRSGVYWP